MANEGNPMVENRSMLKDFLASIITMTGDLSNITAPPFVLDKRSVIEIPSVWAENPSIFISPNNSENPIQRALLVLRSFVSGLKSQCYMGHSPEAGVKKPLNAFLGELFIGKWEDENGITNILSEQVSHHPPITACRVWNDKHGIFAEGYNRQSVTFDGSVKVHCTGHILKTLTKYDEHYLMPIPSFKIKNVLSTPYPETDGTYYLPSSNGYTSVIHFSGKSFFSSSSKKHTFTAHLFSEKEGESNPLYTVEGHWDTQFTIRDNSKDEIIETFNVDDQAIKKAPQLMVDPIDQQDPWESRNAWKDVIEALNSGNMQGVTDAKVRLEDGQRAMREDEEKQGKTWEPLFFHQSSHDELVERLNKGVPNESFQKSKSESEGIWKFNPESWKQVKKPYHGSLRPDNTQASEARNPNKAAEQPIQEKQPTQEAAVQARALPIRPKSREIYSDNREAGDGQELNVNGAQTNPEKRIEPNPVQEIAKEQSGPQVAQANATNENRGSGIQGMSIEERHQIENMIRDQYSSGSKERRASRAIRKSLDKPPA